MAETSKAATEAQAAPEAEAQEAAQPSQEDAGAPSEPNPTPAESAMARELAEARKEAARYRTEAKKSSEALKAKEDEQLSELEKAQRRVADLERERDDLLTRDQERRLHVASVDTAARLGFRSPEVAFRLLDRADVEFADDGQPTNVEDLLKLVLEREPYLAKPASAGDFGGGNRGTTPPSNVDMDALIKRAARG